ncbi:MAG: imidazole glycerol phosphate synthase subunit HisH, partial [Algoriphagus sp.]
MKVVLIQYNSGNVQSVLYALERLGVEAELTDDPEKILSADRVIFPGQGEASSAMDYLKERKLDQVIREIKQPFLGICLGLQLLCAHSEENDIDCLGIFPIKVKRFIPAAWEKVPHVGWNKIENIKENPLLNHLPDVRYLYYVGELVYTARRQPGKASAIAACRPSPSPISRIVCTAAAR